MAVLGIPDKEYNIVFHEVIIDRDEADPHGNQIIKKLSVGLVQIGKHSLAQKLP